MPGKLGELAVVFTANTKKLDKALLDVQKKLKKTESGFLALGKSLTRKLTLPLALAAGAAIKFAADFDKAMTESLAIMGNVSANLRKEMMETAKVMSEDSVFAAKDLAAAYFFLASAGLNAEQSIALLPVVTRFAQAGMFDLSTATDLLTDAQSALGLSVDDVVKNEENMIRVSDALVGANTLANATVQQFSEALTNQAAAAFRTVNKEVEETVAVLAAFADQGRKGQVAGQQLAIVMTNLQSAWLDNREEFEKLNIEVFDAQGNMKNMADIIGDLEKALKDLTPEQKIATLATLGFQDRARKTIQTLLGTSEKIRQYEKDLRSMGGITKEVSDNQMKSFSAQMKALGSTLQNLAIDIGNQFIPIIKVLGAVVKFIAQEFRKLPGIFKAVAAAVIVLGAAIGPVLVMYATWIKFSKALIGIQIIAFLGKAKIAMLAFAAANAPLIAVLAGVLAAGKAIDEGIKIYVKAVDKAIAKEIQIGDALGKTNALRKKLIKAEIVTIEEWSAMIKKHGGDYKRVLIAINNHPAYKGIREKLKGVSKATKNWADILKKQGIPSIKEYQKEISDLVKRKKILKAALKAGKISLRTYTTEVKKTDEKIASLTGNTKKLKKETKTWLDFLKNMGIKTLKEKADRVEELERFLEELDQAYKDGKISLEDYIESTKAAKDEIAELSTTIIDTLVPAARDMSGVLKQAADDMKTNFFGPIEEGAKKTESAFSVAFEGIVKTVADSFKDIIKGGASLADLLDNVLDAAIDSIVDNIGVLVSEWGKGMAGMEKDSAATSRSIQGIFVSMMAAFVTETLIPLISLIAGSGGGGGTGPVDKDRVRKGPFDKDTARLIDTPDAMARAWATAKEKGLDAMAAMVKSLRDTGRSFKEVTDFVLGQLNRIPSALSTLVSNADSPEGLAGLADIFNTTFQAMMAEGMSFMDAVTAMQGPLDALKEKYLELGLAVPEFLKPMIELTELMEEQPEIFQNLDAATTILEALTNSAYITQDAFDALAQSATDFAKAVLGVSGDLNKALKNMDLTENQIQKLLPTVSQFVGTAALFGLQVPDWMKTFVTDQLGVDFDEFAEIAAAQANAGVATVEQLKKLLDANTAADKQAKDTGKEITDAIGGTESILKEIRDATEQVEEAISNLESAQGGASFTSKKSSLIAIHPNEEVDIVPSNSVSMGGNRGESMMISATFNINAIDGNSIQTIVEDEIGPRFIEMVAGNIGESRTGLREAQGNRS